MRRFQDQMVLNKTHQSGSPHNQFRVRAITLKGTIYPSELVNGRNTQQGIFVKQNLKKFIECSVEGEVVLKISSRQNLYDFVHCP